MGTWMHRLWHDDDGAIIAAEFLIIAALVAAGATVGFCSIRDSVNADLAELSNSFLALNQSYFIGGQAGCCAAVEGSCYQRFVPCRGVGGVGVGDCGCGGCGQWGGAAWTSDFSCGSPCGNRSGLDWLPCD